MSRPYDHVSREQSRSVDCPTCGAKASEPCIGKRGKLRVSSHKERQRAYWEATQ